MSAKTLRTLWWAGLLFFWCVLFGGAAYHWQNLVPLRQHVGSVMSLLGVAYLPLKFHLLAWKR